MDWSAALRKHLPVRFVWDMGALYFEKRVSRSAAELAYFLTLSFFPLLLCLNTLVGMARVDIRALLAGAQGLIPDEVGSILEDYLGYIGGGRPGLLAVGAVMTLWSSSAAFRALMHIMGDLYGERPKRGLWQVGASVLYSLLLLVSIHVSILVLVTGEWFFRELEQVLPFPLPGTNWSWLRFLVLFWLMLTLILVVYRLSAPRGKRGVPLFAGALLAAAALVGASGLFSRLIGVSAKYSLVYGSLGSVIILLVWLYLCGNILILGNVFNCVWYRYKGKKA